MTVEERLEQLELQQAMLVEAQRRTIEGRWSGADGAAGIIVAIEGGQTTIHPADFPPK